MNEKAQAGLFSMIFGIIGLVIVIMLLANFTPVFQEQFNIARNYDSLNCKSTTVVCPITTADGNYCYNSTLTTDTVSCAMIDMSLPIIIILVVIGAVALMLSGRNTPEQTYNEGY